MISWKFSAKYRITYYFSDHETLQDLDSGVQVRHEDRGLQAQHQVLLLREEACWLQSPDGPTKKRLLKPILAKLFDPAYILTSAKKVLLNVT